MSGSGQWRRLRGKVPDDVANSPLTLAELQARLVAALAKEWADRRKRGRLDVLATNGEYVMGQWQGPNLLVLRLHEPFGSRNRPHPLNVAHGTLLGAPNRSILTSWSGYRGRGTGSSGW